MTLCHDLSHKKQGVVDQDDAEDVEDAAQRLERQDLFLTRADMVVRPLFRYCQYELKQAGQATMEEPRLITNEDSRAATTTSSGGGSNEEETSIVFRGHELVPESKELRVLLLKLQSLQHDDDDDETTKEKEESKQPDNNNTDETSFLNALIVLDDALDVVQKQLATLQKVAQNAGPAVVAKRQHYLHWKGYFQSQKTQRVMLHTQELLRDISGHAERVHVYESLLQHAKSLLELNHGDSNTNDNDDEDEFALQTQANILRLRANKTYHMAMYYYQQPRKYPAAWALLQQAAHLRKRAQEEIAACEDDMPHADAHVQELEALPIASAKAAIQAAWYLQGGNTKRGAGTGTATTGRHSTDRPLWLRLPDDDAGKVLAGELLPMPIPSKPVFYDLAYDYAMDASEGMGTIQAYVDKHTVSPEPVEEPKSSSGSLLGWLTGSK
jgi:hypothetical protein